MPKSFAVGRVNVTHLEFRLQISCHWNLSVFPTKNTKPVACCKCNSKLGKLIWVEDVEMVSSALFVYRISKGGCLHRPFTAPE